MSETHIVVPKIVRDLKDAFPFGHPRFVSTVVSQIKLHSDKNHDYARGGDPLGNFIRIATMLKLWPNFPYDTPEGVAFIYALKQVDAEAWTMCQGGDCKVEGLGGRTDDQAVYANLRRCMRDPKDVPEVVEEMSMAENFTAMRQDYFKATEAEDINV
jgi:hypothetical protein